MVSYCVSAFRSDFPSQYAEIETATKEGADTVTLALLEALIRVRSEPTRQAHHSSDTGAIRFPISLSVHQVAERNHSYKNLTDDRVKQFIIQESIRAYPGNYACPYQRVSNGSLCGNRSAYSRPGGAAPVCYSSDVTQNMIKHYLRQ